MKNRTALQSAKVKEDLILVSFLSECFSYNPENGEILWKTRPRNHFNSDQGHSGFNTRYAGKNACSVSGGYFCLSFRHKEAGKVVKVAHRVAWAIHHKSWPDFILDHVNGDTFDNSIKNLRLATPMQNSSNRVTTNKSGFIGVVKKSDGFYANVKIGPFKEPEDAAREYDKHAFKLSGEFAKLNDI